MTEIAGIQIPFPPWVVLPVYLALLAALSFLIGVVLRSMWARAAARTESRFDDVMVEALPGPLAVALFLGGAYLALLAVNVPARWVATADRVFRLALIVLLVVALMRLLVGLVGEYTLKNPSLAPATNIAKILTRIFVIAVGMLMAFDAMGVAIAPILTTLGVGSLAVALALQDTLANFFSGLYLLADRPIAPGEFVQLESGLEGTVDSIGWRTTRILTVQSNIVIVPNAKLAQSVITNYDKPGRLVSQALTVGVSYEADVARVEKILLEEYRSAVGAVDGLVPPPPEPRVLLSNFLDSAVEVALVVHVSEWRKKGLVLEQLRRRILARLRAEGIDIPYPQRTVHLLGSRAASGT